ncbi:MAG: alpha/beta hydrolase [Chloroflexi bacterium]|nr:alpha/beta hydrolase [Chloroflexota bacterium]
MDNSRRIVVNGQEIRERVVGEGDPVLMIHGWGANLELLGPLAQNLEGFDYRLYMLDLPGFGGSAEPPAPYTIFDYAAFCIAYLDLHRLEQVHYFGHSLGGRIGLILGSDYSDRLKSMVLSNSAGIKSRQPMYSQLRLRLYRSVRKSLNRLGAAAIAQDLRQRYNKRYGSPDFQAASGVMRKTLVNVIGQDLLPNAYRVNIPTVLIWGDADTETPLWMGEKLERAIPDAALIVHEGAGHYAYLDYARRTASIMNALYSVDDSQVT